MLFNAGAQVPVIPLLDVVGKAVRLPPEQIGATEVNVGVIGLPAVTHVCVLQSSLNV